MASRMLSCVLLCLAFMWAVADEEGGLAVQKGEEHNTELKTNAAATSNGKILPYQRQLLLEQQKCPNSALKCPSSASAAKKPNQWKQTKTGKQSRNAQLTDVIDTTYCDYKSDDDLLVLGSDCEEHSACNSGICSAGMSYTDFRDDSLREMPAKCCPCAGNSCGPGRTCWFGRCFSHSAAASDPCLACGQCPNITQRGKGHANITQTLDFQTVCKRVSDLGEEGWSCQPSEDDYMEYNLKAKKRNCYTQEAGDCFPNHWAYASNTWCKPGSVLIPSYGSDSPIPNGVCTKTLPAENDATKATCRGTGRICGKVQNNRNNWVVISKESGIAGDFALHTLGTNRRRRVSHIISAKCQVNIRSTVIDDPEIPNTTARLMCFLCCVQTQKRVACIKNTSKTVKFLQAWYQGCSQCSSCFTSAGREKSFIEFSATFLLSTC